MARNLAVIEEEFTPFAEPTCLYNSLKPGLNFLHIQGFYFYRIFPQTYLLRNCLFLLQTFETAIS